MTEPLTTATEKEVLVVGLALGLGVGSDPPDPGQ